MIGGLVLRVALVPLRAAKAVYNDVQDFRRLRNQYIDACRQQEAARMTIYEGDR